MNSLPSAVHVSSTIVSGAPRILCLAMFANSSFSTFIQSPMNLLLSAVHASATIEYGAPRSYCVERCSCILHQRVWSPVKLLRSAVRQFSILHLFRSPINLLPSAVHASSTNEFGVLRSYCVVLFANSPFSTFFGAP